MICNFCLSVAARPNIDAGPSLRYTLHVSGKFDNQQNNKSNKQTKTITLKRTGERRMDWSEVLQKE